MSEYIAITLACLVCVGVATAGKNTLPILLGLVIGLPIVWWMLSYTNAKHRVQDSPQIARGQ
jgi:hypothetical protein